MVIKTSKNKFSLIKNLPDISEINKNTLILKNNILISIIDNQFKYTISIYLKGLYKDSIVLSYINNFLIIDFKFKGSSYSSLNYKRTFYLKDIDITKTQNLCSSGVIYITLPKNSPT